MVSMPDRTMSRRGAHIASSRASTTESILASHAWPTPGWPPAGDSSSLADAKSFPLAAIWRSQSWVKSVSSMFWLSPSARLVEHQSKRRGHGLLVSLCSFLGDVEGSTPVLSLDEKTEVR